MIEAPFEIDRRTPIEISALIIDNLHNDFLSLRNVALVCKDFAYLARAHIFRKVDLTAVCNDWDDFPLVERFATPHATSTIENLVQTLHVAPGFRVTDFAFILQSLSSLAAVRIIFATVHHLQIIETHLGGRLRELWINRLRLRDHTEFQLLQKTLASLSTLNILGLRTLRIVSWVGEAAALILPQSLKFLSLDHIDVKLLRAIAEGMVSQPIMLHAIFLAFASLFEDGSNQLQSLLAGLVAHIPVVFIIWANDMDPLSSLSLSHPMYGLKATEPMFSCIHSNALAGFLARLIFIMPESFRRICIDVDASSSPHSLFDPLLFPAHWRSLDAALCKRHNNRMLEYVLFRCTMRTRPFLPTPSNGAILDRSILDHIKQLLPESTKLGFINVDHATVDFEPTFEPTMKPL